MSLSTAQRLAWNLARALMTVMVLIRTDDGYAVLPWEEFDGDASLLVREYDPFPS